MTLLKKSGFATATVILIVAILIVAGGAGYYFYRTSEAPVDDCEKITTSHEKDNCYSNIATENKDANLCEKITSSSLRDNCYFKIAQQTKDSGPCQKITDSTRKDDCYLNIAQQTQEDSSLCEKINNDTKKDDCYIMAAIETKDAALCEKMTTVAKKDICYFNVVSETKDASLCEKITDNIRKNVCYAIATNDVNLCKKITDNVKKEECYAHVAIKNKDSGLCEKITIGYLKDWCHTDIAIKAKQVEPKQVIDETANWKIYRNEEYGFEVKYPSYFRLGYVTSPGDPELEKIDDLNKGLPSFKGVPEDDELYIHIMAFNSLLETSDEPIELVFTEKDAQEERQKLEQSVIGDPWQFRSEKPYGKVIGISGRKAAQYLKFSPQWGGYNTYFITYNNGGDRIELSVYLKSLTKEEAEKETRNVIFNQILLTFKFIEK